MESLPTLYDLYTHQQCDQRGSQSCEICNYIKNSIPKCKNAECWSPATEEDLLKPDLLIPELFKSMPFCGQKNQ